jgi:hypothetical protein
VALSVGLGACLVLAALTLLSIVAPEPEPLPIDLVRPTPRTTPASSLPAPSASASPAALSDAAPTRVAIADMQIDLPIVKPEPDESYPLCDVAEYRDFYSVPGLPGVTYLYAHAQKGMFLPLLEASRIDDGVAMLGRSVLAYTDDDLVRTYEITEVHRHSRSLAVVDAIVGDALVLQTSETAQSSGSKLVIVARQLGPADSAAASEAHPEAKPRVCTP